MIFPYGDDQVHGGHRPLLSHALLLANAAVFVWQLSVGTEGALAYAAVPAHITAGRDWHTLWTSLFLHGGLAHLLGNMLFLWIFADNVEATVGTPVFALFYAAGGAVATLAHVVVDPVSPVPLVGASGAISAVLGAYLVLYPASRIKTFVFFFPVRIPALLFLGFWFYGQMSSAMATLSGAESGVAWWAHIGGFAFGLAGGAWMRGRFQPARLAR